MSLKSATTLLGSAICSTLLMTGTARAANAPAPAPLPAPSQNRPNVLFIAVDDLKPLLGCYGQTDIKTPNLDRLAAHSLVFLNNQCQQAVCGPTRASLMTGWRPDHTGVWDLKTRMRDINPDLVTIPQYFRTQGYTAVSMGKIHDGRCCDGWMQDDIKSWDTRVQAPDRHPGMHEGNYVLPETVARIRQLRKEAQARGLTGEDLAKAIDYRPSTECADVPDDAYRDGSMALTAAQWVGKLAHEQKPFFLAVGFDRPHLPFNAPKKYWDMYPETSFQVNPFQQHAAGSPSFAYQDSGELRSGYSDAPRSGPFPDEMQLRLIHGYYASVSYIDAQIGIVLDALDKEDAARNTIVVLWGDHGWHLGDHGMFCKHTNFEQATRAPLIIYSPNLQPAAKTTSCPTEFVDVFPTLCDLAGLSIPGNLEGVSLKPLFTQPEKPVKALAISQYPRNPDGKPAMGYSYRGQRYRYTRWIQKDFRKGQTDGQTIGVELYDYQTDPMETRNLAEDPAHAAIVTKFEKLIANGWQGLRGHDSEGL